MAADTRPPIFGTAMEGWRYVFAAVSRMPIVLGAGMVAWLAVSVVRQWFAPDLANLFLQTEAAGGPDFAFFQRFQTDHVVGFLLMVVRAFLITPVLIAMHRFVLLGEVSPYYTINPSQPRFMRFFLFSIVFQLLFRIPWIGMTAFSNAASAPGLSGPLALIGGLASVALGIVLLVVAARLLILFPAIAVEARGAEWRNAIADSRGNMWRMVLTIIVTALPVGFVSLVVGGATGWIFAATAADLMQPVLIVTIMLSVMTVLMMSAFAAVASRFFAAFANKLSG
jgi:hypothetical protein